MKNSRRMGERDCYDAPGTATHALICKPAKESPTAAPLLPANISGMDSTSHPLTFTISLPHPPASFIHQRKYQRRCQKTKLRNGHVDGNGLK
ncbi:hypothetical protein [[Clostridium] scindens]|uniref:hypothetical protein n=1 Tax=Clostridium scindens (strain JCM 10418 / VPI 12708) TaxID=29347 RepID=UPI001D0942C8|nr:hypothetical protein [[Clostridium] scindens]MCB6419469.1 hypothetical protein [[Clostridium] scindens]